MWDAHLLIKVGNVPLGFVLERRHGEQQLRKCGVGKKREYWELASFDGVQFVCV